MSSFILHICEQCYMCETTRRDMKKEEKLHNCDSINRYAVLFLFSSSIFFFFVQSEELWLVIFFRSISVELLIY